MGVLAIFEHANHISNYYLKLRQWKVDIEQVKDIMLKCVQHFTHWKSLPGAQTSTSWSPIHLAALLDDVESLKLLLEMDPECLTVVYTNFRVTPIMCAAYSGGMDCVTHLLTFGPVVLMSPKALIMWAVKGGNQTCCAKLFELKAFQVVQPDLYELIVKDALGDDNLDMLHLILKYFPDTAFRLTRTGDNTLSLAAGKGLSNVLAHLLRIGVAVNHRNKFGMVALHAAILKLYTDESAVKILEMLLENGAEPNYAKIGTQESPLYYAAARGFSKCVFTLLKHGAKIDPKHTIQKLNAQIPNFFQVHLNRLVTLTGVSNTQSQALIAINLSFTGNLNNQLELSETYFLKFLVLDGQEKYLLHPVIETYLAVKWKFVRRFYFASFGFYMLTVVLFSIYVMETYVIQQPESSRHEQFTEPDAFHIQPYWWLSSVTVIMQILSLSLRFGVNYDRYFKHFFVWGPRGQRWITVNVGPKTSAYAKVGQTLYKLWLISELWVKFNLLVGLMGTTLAAGVRRPGDIPEWQYTIAAISVFSAWAYVLDYLRTQPTLGIYVEMLLKVFVNLIKFLLTYISLLIGFVISFMVLYRGQGPFGSFPHALIRVFNMMVGEMGFDTMFLNEPKIYLVNETGNATNQITQITADQPTAVHVLFIIFIITVTIALINLLIGLAVSDIKGLRKRSKLHKTLKQISFIADLERFIFSKTVRRILPKRLMVNLEQSIQLPSTHHIIYVYPNNSNDKRLPKLLKMEALQIAIRNNMELAGDETVKDKLEAQLTTIQAQLEYLVKQKRGIQ